VLVHSTINANLSTIVDYDAKAIKLALANHMLKEGALIKPVTLQVSALVTFATRDVCYIVTLLAIYIKKYLKPKEELQKLKHFTMQKIIIFKKASKRNQNPSRHYNSITNLKFQHNPKYHLSKNAHIKINLFI
jgi:hypothetical protein